MTTPDDRKLAEDALALAEIEAKPFYESNYGEKSTNGRAMIAIVPDLATRLLAALDRVDELEAEINEMKKPFKPTKASNVVLNMGEV